jgi:hypothetical protein
MSPERFVKGESERTHAMTLQRAERLLRRLAAGLFVTALSHVEHHGARRTQYVLKILGGRDRVLRTWPLAMPALCCQRPPVKPLTKVSIVGWLLELPRTVDRSGRRNCSNRCTTSLSPAVESSLPQRSSHVEVLPAPIVLPCVWRTNRQSV